MSKTVIIGGVAGGASAAARLRRLDETMEIVILERGDYISYANCGLPYHIGDVIKERSNLLLQTPELMKSRYNVDVRVRNEVVGIDPDRHIVTVKGDGGETYEEGYDDLIIATGSSPARPNIPGADIDGIYSLWTINDTDRIRGVVDERQPKDAVILGAGFIGLEVAENLHKRGVHVSVIDHNPQVMKPLDRDMAGLLAKNMRDNGVTLYLSSGIESFERRGEKIAVEITGVGVVETDMVIVSAGVRPNSGIAREAGIELNERGGI
ncbi:MAG: FAD-dependent oxidoreductase, partial [Eubacterium sp.]|nr:FAD-dependent oxidoreductase [Eubacterium sp.]